MKTPTKFWRDSRSKNITPYKLACELGISPSAVYKWEAEGAVPAKRIKEVERITGIPREEILPDLFK